MGLPYSNMDYSSEGLVATDFITDNLLTDTTATEARTTLGIGHLIPSTSETDANKILTVNSSGNGVQFATAFFEPLRIHYLLNAKLNAPQSINNGTFTTIAGYVDAGSSTDFSDMASNGSWTCPSSGTYKITANVQGQNDASRAKNLFLQILIGSVIKKECGFDLHAGGTVAEDYGQFAIAGEVILVLATNDVLKMKVRLDFLAGSSIIRGNSTSTFTNLIIERLIL